MKHQILSVFTFGAATIFSSISMATLNTGASRGEKVFEIAVPTAGRNSEICVIPKHFASATYADSDLKSEKDLCSLNEYSNVAFCPKTNSTNPGVDVHLIPQGYNRGQVEAANCSIVDPQSKENLSKKVAKYKLSTSCSYTPSILGYYHVSRALGFSLNIPVSVLRTLDLPKHISLARKALAITPTDDIIHTTWTSLYAQLIAGAQASRRDFLLTSKFDQSYGALLVKPKSDFFKEFFFAGKDNVERATNFRDKSPIVAMLNKNVAISTLVGRDFTAANVQTMTHLKDVSDMILLDTLMNQQDRYGNIDVMDFFAYLDPADVDGNGLPKFKVKTKLDPNEAAKLGAVQIKRVVLSDNDCGVSKDNINKQVALQDRVLHMDPETYYRLLRLDAIADHADTKAFYATELLFTNGDYTGFRRNLKDLASKFHQACAQGKLLLDLDVHAHFSGQPLPKLNCDLR